MDATRRAAPPPALRPYRKRVGFVVTPDAGSGWAGSKGVGADAPLRGGLGAFLGSVAWRDRGRAALLGAVAATTTPLGASPRLPTMLLPSDVARLVLGKREEGLSSSSFVRRAAGKMAPFAASRLTQDGGLGGSSGWACQGEIHTFQCFPVGPRTRLTAVNIRRVGGHCQSPSKTIAIAKGSTLVCCHTLSSADDVLLFQCKEALKANPHCLTKNITW